MAGITFTNRFPSVYPQILQRKTSKKMAYWKSRKDMYVRYSSNKSILFGKRIKPYAKTKTKKR